MNNLLLFFVFSHVLKGGIIPPSDSLFIPNQALIKLIPSADAENFFEKHNLIPVRYSEYGKFWTITWKDKTAVDAMIKKLKYDPNVQYASKNAIFYITNSPFWIPNDPYLSYQWNLEKIRVFSAWDIEQGGDTTVIVGTLDTGCAYEDFPVPSYEKDEIDSTTTMYKKAPDFNEAFFVPGYDFVHNDAHSNDDHGHGTHVAGTIIESTNNGIGVAGIAFKVKLMPIKVINSLGWGSTDWVTDGVYYAATHGVDVLNMSIATSADPGPIFYQAIQYAASQGVIMVAGAGNNATSPPTYPAIYPEVIGVGATNSADSLAFYSNYGDSIELVAPGGDLVDRDNNGFPDLIVQQIIGMREIGFPKPKPDTFFYAGMAGTSMATPHISAVISLMLSHGIPKENVRTILRETSVDLGALGYDTIYGYGRIDAFCALGGEDTLPPSITNTTQWNDTNFTGPFPVWSEIQDLFGINNKYLFYKFNTEPYDSLTPCDSILQKYLFMIPSALPGTYIRYYIKAKDLSGNVQTAPEGAPGVTYGFIVLGTDITEKPTNFLEKRTIIIPHKMGFRLKTNKEVDFKIYNILGQVLKKGKLKPEEEFFWFPDSKGVYFFYLYKKSGQEYRIEKIFYTGLK